MSDNVIDFESKRPHKFATHMFNLQMYEDEDGKYEVELEINEIFDDEEIGEAMMAAAVKFMSEKGLIDDSQET